MQKLRLWLVLAALLLLFAELAAFVTVKWAQSSAKRARVAGILWPGSHHTEQEIDAAFLARDDLLGWPTAEQIASARFDAAGARPSPAFPDVGEPCVATFGDSFTYGQQATNEQAWGNRLAERLNCRVANYGVPGYGVDQAYLRYGRKRAKIASASVVVIGFFPENIMRHVNQYVGFRVGRPNLLFKPRFVSDDGSLQLHPPISREVFDENKLNESPAELLPHEFFLPGSRYGPVPASFPYSLAAVRALMHPRVIASIRGRPSWIDLYQSERDSEPRDLTGKLIEAFARDVESSGKAPLVFVFANASSVRTFLETNEWPYQPILSFLAEIGIPYLHFGTKLAETYGENVCDVFMKETLLGCTGHYTPEGYAMVAEMIAGRLRATRLVSPRPR